MNEILFDTNILIDHLRGVDAASELLSKVEKGEITGYISVITEAELYAGKDTEQESKRKELSELLYLFIKVEVDSVIAQASGDFKRKYKILLPDAIIAATAFNLHYKLITQNLKDFEKIKEISSEKPY